VSLALRSPRETDTGDLEEAFFQSWEPEPELTVSQWADQHRWLSSVASAEQGRWRTSRTPYLREIMDKLSVNDPTQIVCVMKAAQLGFTEAGINWVGYVIHHAPGPMLVLQPTLEMLKKVSKQKLAPAIAATPALAELIGPSRERDSGNTIFTKEWPGGILMMATANSPASMRMMSVRYLFPDECEAYPGDVGGEGDPIELAMMRTVTYRSRRKCFCPSTPGDRNHSRIEDMVRASDQRRYYIPCPECGHMDFLTFTGFGDYCAQEDAGHHFISWKRTPIDNPDARGATETHHPETAHMVCSGCKASVPSSKKAWMVQRGEWRATVPEKANGLVAGYQISALYTLIGQEWSEIVSDFLRVKNDPIKLKVWVNTVLGETWEERVGMVGWKALQARVEDYPEGPEPDSEQRIPNGVGVLVAGIDVQANRVDWSVWGFGEGEESWLIATAEEPGDPTKPEPWMALDRILTDTFIHESGQPMKIQCVAVDSGFATDQVYKFCSARLAAGRRVYPVKGGGEYVGPLVGQPTRQKGYHIPLYTLCTGTGKRTLYSRLAIQEIGPGHVHFPRWLERNDEFFLELTAERPVWKFVKGKGSVETWDPIRDDNHELDKAVYAMAALYILGRGRCPIWLWARAAELAKPLVGAPPPEPDSGIRIPPALQRPRRRNWVTGWNR